MCSIFRTIALFIVLTACSQNAVLALSPSVEQASAAEAYKGIAKTLEELQQQVPPNYLSPESVADINDYDPEKIVGWIKQNIQFTPTPGYQLSPQVALQHATGNALEQAQLLQNVLVQAGLEVRVAKATLTAEQANTLLQESFVLSPARQWQLDSALREKYFHALSIQAGGSKDSLNKRHISFKNLTPWTESGVYSEAQAQAAKFSGAIKIARGDQALSGTSLLEPWLANAQDYYFIKYRFSQGDPWKEAHPAFTQSQPSITDSTYFTGTLKNHHHQLTLQAFITRDSNGKTETIPVTGLHQTTIAELFEQQLQFATVASGMQQAIQLNSLETLESGQIFAPTIDGAMAKNARLFSLDGKDYSPSEINNSMSAVSISNNKRIEQNTSSLNEAFGTSAKQLGDSPVSQSRLVHYYLVIEWSAPNGRKRSLQRTLYREHTDQNPAQILESVTQRAVLAAAGALTPAAEMHASLDTLRSAFLLLAKIQSNEYSESQVFAQLSEWASNRNDLIFNAAARLSSEPTNAARLFYHAPVLAIKWEQRASGASSNEAGKTTFDYLINAAQVAVLEEGKIKIVPQRTLNYGVWSTYAEALLMSKNIQRESLPAGSASAASAFNTAIAGKKFTVINASNLTTEGVTKNTTIPQSLASSILANPQYVFLVPRSDKKMNPTAYYRVDPLSGETLGYTMDGRGSSAEHVAFTVNMIQTTVAAGKMLACIVKGDAEGEQITCLGCATLQYAISLIGGAYWSTVGAAVGEGVGDVACSWT